ncbi:MAG: hypothetical protein KJ061_05235, partial [Vicinamibacteraceae bacterium]|nr:hypothetical protein [Vicinamibacteraceae bacterium]
SSHPLRELRAAILAGEDGLGLHWSVISYQFGFRLPASGFRRPASGFRLRWPTADGIFPATFFLTRQSLRPGLLF